MIEHATDENFELRRVHHAPRELVFAAMTTPEHLTHFWGPAGTSTPLSGIVVDLRPGGAFETTMINDVTGQSHTMRAVYLQVEVPSLLVWRERDSAVVSELRFRDLGNGMTEVLTIQRGLPPQMRTPQARAGWGTALDRYAAYLQTLAVRRATLTNRLLLAGGLAGPGFVISSLLQAITRDGFDMQQQPPSALALGTLGWIQTATFMISGAGFALGAWGLRRANTGRAGRFAPVWVALFGLALLAAGVFAMDPAFGYPPGTPDGVGASVSWHAAIHGVLFPLGLLALGLGGASLSRRYATQGQPVARWAALILVPVVLGLCAWPSLGGDPQGRFVPMWVGVAIAFTAVSGALLAARTTPSAKPQRTEEAS